MDLLQTLLVRSQGEIRPVCTQVALEGLGSNSSQGCAAPRSPPPPPTLPQSSPPASQPLMSDSLTLSQSTLDTLERSHSCGQDENVMSESGKTSPPGVQSLPHRDNIRSMQDENRIPGLQTNLPSQPHDNITESRDDFSDISSSPRVQSMANWDKDNPFNPQQKRVPINVPRSTGEWSTKFQHRCDQLGLKPEFSYAEVKEQSFNASLRVGEWSLTTPEPKPNKKLAKEEVCKLAVERMPAVEKMEGVERAGKKRTSEDAALEAASVSRADRSEDWISILNVHCQQSQLARPVYLNHLIQGGHQRFVAELRIAERLDQAFRSDERGYGTKKDAESAVAKAAVLWLRDRGVLSDAPSKRQRGSSTETPLEAAGIPQAKSLPEQVHDLGMDLGLKMQPKWVLRPSTLPSGQSLDGANRFFDCHAEFDERDTMLNEVLRGRVGEVKNCLGQKKAKESCCELVLPILEEIRRRRFAMI